ncbi:MAG: hypothetical protein NZ853_01255 [Leptospiraceae bacterium]|nr:hypothetical protein [Leptospiraceae bacterium]MDW7976145.1 hypothetical protein [Leptospiraceae bacterium]
MFEKYFIQQSNWLQESLNKRLEKKGISIPEKKDLSIFKEFFDFIKEHIPIGFSLAMGKIRNKTHVYGKNVDLIIYKKWTKSLLKLSGGYILVDHIYAFLSIEQELSTDSLIQHIEMTNSIKTMYAMDYELDESRIIPVYSILFAYKSRIPLLSHKLTLINASHEKEIPPTKEVDLICVLDQGVIIKDWEMGIFKIIETKEDTLMWFYIMLIEYLDRDNEIKVDLRRYIREVKEYAEK